MRFSLNIGIFLRSWDFPPRVRIFPQDLEYFPQVFSLRIGIFASGFGFPTQGLGFFPSGFGIYEGGTNTLEFSSWEWDWEQFPGVLYSLRGWWDVESHSDPSGIGNS